MIEIIEGEGCIRVLQPSARYMPRIIHFIYRQLLATDYASYVMILYYILNMLRLILSTHVCVYNVCVGMFHVFSDAETMEEVGKEVVRPNSDPKP